MTDSAFSYEPFLINPADYEDIREIGNGRFGTMYESFKKPNKDQKFAIRKTTLKDEEGNEIKGDSSTTRHFLREVEIFIQIRAQPVIVKFYGFFLSPQMIVFEYLENGSLASIFKRLQRGEKVPEWNGTTKSKTVFGIATAILHLQNQGAFHRYLTPSSILFDKNFEPRLVDFAYAKVDTNEDTTKSMITNKTVQIYQAPEIDEGRYNRLVDNYSYGVILYQIVTGKEAFDSKGPEFKVKRQIHDGMRPPIPEDECPKLAPIIGDLWSNNPDDRAEFIDIIKALNDYNEELFPGTDMEAYRQYRDRVLKSTFLTRENLNYINQPVITKEDEDLFETYIIAAKKGDTKNMLKVARDYEKGIGTEQDIGEAIDWYQKAADKGEPEALYKIANFYCVGCPVFDPDPEEYVNNLKKASDKNYPPAIIDYAVLLQTGNSGVTQDVPKAEQMFKKMADEPYSYGEAQYFLAQLYESTDKPEEAVKYYNKARENGIEGAHCDYASMLLEGKGVHANQPEGIKILKQAAERGFPMANFNLGYIYEYGRYGQEKNAANAKQSLKYYQVAADKGMPKAMVKVAKALFKGVHAGEATEKDPVRAARLFEQAASMGEPEGLHSWGTFLQHYHTPDDKATNTELNERYGGTPINIELAVEFYKLAANAGFVPSMTRLGELYEKGIAGNRNIAEAKRYLEMAVAKGSKVAKKLLSELDSE
ncbi:hypothetical protein M9Y10_022244 [Tritrichomonas musculus]|uniref:Protein kinase domain-containing protein n=1 Tax=Tritrichomonas musculus TaxID=1915356 RepID=A0ABR2KRT1_9EUKA